MTQTFLATGEQRGFVVGFDDDHGVRIEATWARAGVNRSTLVMHHRICPWVRAAMPAANRMAAAPHRAPVAPPKIARRDASARPSPGKTVSIAARPNGSVAASARLAPTRLISYRSLRRTASFRRSASLLFLICSKIVLESNPAKGDRCAARRRAILSRVKPPVWFRIDNPVLGRRVRFS